MFYFPHRRNRGIFKYNWRNRKKKSQHSFILMELFLFFDPFGLPGLDSCLYVSGSSGSTVVNDDSNVNEKVCVFSNHCLHTYRACK